MYGLPEGVVALGEEPFNIGGTACWNCHYPNAEMARSVLADVMNTAHSAEFVAKPGDCGDRARIVWCFKEKSYEGEVLVNSDLTPIGFMIEIGISEMVFNLKGEHIPGPRFPVGHPTLAASGC